MRPPVCSEKEERSLCLSNPGAPEFPDETTCYSQPSARQVANRRLHWASDLGRNPCSALTCFERPRTVLRRSAVYAGRPAAGVVDAAGGTLFAGIPRVKGKAFFCGTGAQSGDGGGNHAPADPPFWIRCGSAVLRYPGCSGSDGAGLPVCGGRGDFAEGGGIQMEFRVGTAAEIARLDHRCVAGRLEYVAQALRILKTALGSRTALLGFAGSPWTLASYMIEGGSRGDGTKPKALFYAEPAVFGKLMEKLTAAVTEFLNLQIAAGADAVQIFDSRGGDLADNAFEMASGKWIREIIAGLDGSVPVILFGKGAHGRWASLASTGASILSLDWTQSIAEVRAQIPQHVGVQGNLDPSLLCTTPGIVARETARILHAMSGQNGHIFNLGHGVPPTAKLECIQALVDTVQAFER